MKRILLIMSMILMIGLSGCSQKKDSPHKTEAGNQSEPIKYDTVYAEVVGYNDGRIVVRYNGMNTYTDIKEKLPVGSKVAGIEDAQGNFQERK